MFEHAGLLGAAAVMNAVVLTSVLSAGNSGMYASTRMLYALAQQNMAPKIFARVNARGVPIMALIATTVIAALMVRRGEADAMICGTIGKYRNHLGDIRDVIGLRPGVNHPAALSVLILNKGTFFMCDTYVSPEPTVSETVEESDSVPAEAG